MLMVLFHIAYFGYAHPDAKRMVYAFHMPVFLVISGYLTSTYKPWRAFWSSRWFLFLPYAVMEGSYIVAASVLPIREHIDELTVQVFFNKLLLQPLGPYWYIHTLVVCSVVWVVVCRAMDTMSTFKKLLIASIVLYLLSVLGVVGTANAFYFMAGAAIRAFGCGFTHFFKPSWMSIVPIVLLSLTPGLNKESIEGVALTFFVMSFLSCLCSHMPAKVIDYTGRNTLCIVLFSPVFTILSKFFQPALTSFDPSGYVFGIAATIFAVCGSMGVALAMDRLHISKYFMGRDAIYRV